MKGTTRMEGDSGALGPAPAHRDSLVGGTAGLLGAACGAPAAAGAVRRAGARQPVTLRYITEPPRVDSGIKEVVGLWNARGTPVTVELEGVPGSFSEKVLTARRAGVPPDVIHSHPGTTTPGSTPGPC